MKIKFLLLFFLFFFLINNSFANNIAIIDLNYLINNSITGKNIIEKLEKLNTENINLLKKEQLLLSNEKNEIEKKKNILSKDELNQKISILNSKLDEFNKKQQNMSIEFKKLKETQLTNFIKKINPIVEKFMIDNNIDLVLKKESIHISKSEYDITEKLIIIINKNLN